MLATRSLCFAFLTVGYLSLTAYLVVQFWLLAVEDRDDPERPSATVQRLRRLQPLWIGVVGGGLGAALCVFTQKQVIAPPGRCAAIGPIYPLYISLCLIVAARIRMLSTFTTAFALALFIIYFVDLAGRRDMLHYTYDRVNFVASRCTSYAVVRMASQVAVVYWGLPERASLLIWFGYATVESIFMVIADNKSYRFSTRSTVFAFYALLKSALFVGLPLAERGLVSMASSS